MHCTVFGCFFLLYVFVHVKGYWCGSLRTLQILCGYFQGKRKKQEQRTCESPAVKKKVSFCYCFLRAKNNWHY